MDAIKIGNSDLTSSVIGLGCMGMSEFYGERDDAQSLRTLARAFEVRRPVDGAKPSAATAMSSPASACPPG
jgi:hypothetical protein